MTLEQMINEQQMLLNAARTQGRSLTAEEQARFDSLQRSIDAARAASPSGGNGTGSEGHQREGESGEGEGDGSEDPVPHRELCRQRELESRIFVACAATSMWSQISTFRTDQQKIR